MNASQPEAAPPNETVFPLAFRPLFAVTLFFGLASYFSYIVAYLGFHLFAGSVASGPWWEAPLRIAAGVLLLAVVTVAVTFIFTRINKVTVAENRMSTPANFPFGKRPSFVGNASLKARRYHFLGSTLVFLRQGNYRTWGLPLPLQNQGGFERALREACGPESELVRAVSMEKST